MTAPTLWKQVNRCIEELHLLRLALQAEGRRELADMASDLIRGIESMVELLRELDVR
jgi:hypothetical protein